MAWGYAGTTGGSVPLVLTGAPSYLSGWITRLPLTLDTTGMTSGDHLFDSWTALTAVPAMDTKNMTSALYMFRGCAALVGLPAVLDIGNVTDTQQMFSGCTSLRTLPAVLNTAKVKNFSNMFNGCTNLTAVPPLNMVGATFVPTNTFNGCNSLTSAPLTNVKYSISVANTQLDANALNTLFSGLVTTTGQTITITNCPGAATCDRSIATSRGWTVSG